MGLCSNPLGMEARRHPALCLQPGFDPSSIPKAPERYRSDRVRERPGDPEQEPAMPIGPARFTDTRLERDYGAVLGSQPPPPSAEVTVRPSEDPTPLAPK